MRNRMMAWVGVCGLVGALAACGGKEAAPGGAEAAPAKAAEAAPVKAAEAAPAKTPPKAEAEAAAVFAAVGEVAPEFTLTSTDGKETALSSLRGKTVVLEWFNPDCPFVVHAYKEGTLGGLAQKVVSDSVVWLQINSGAPGKQGHGAERNTQAKTEYGLPHAVLLDEDGAVGRRYKATNTPHLYVVDPQGVIRYAGALDNAPFGKVKGDQLVNYVSQALDELGAGKPVSVPETKAYGCSVKYGEI